MAHRDTYIARINRVVDHIDAHLVDALDLSTLAALAHFSPWHFHRLFQALAGETLAERVRRRRLEVAASRLLAAPPVAALTIALDVGFGSAEVFTRAFKAHFGVTPSTWRRGAWQEWAARHREQLGRIHQAQRKTHRAVLESLRHDSLPRPADRVTGPGGLTLDVAIRTLADTRVAYMRHVGPYGSAGISRLWPRFTAWCTQRGLLQAQRSMIGIAQDSPDLTAAEKCRYDACIEVDTGFRPEGEVGVQTLIGARYACVRFTGTALDIHAAWQRVFAHWLPDSGWQADDRPAIELYDKGADTAAPDGSFTCLLCVPLRPL